MPGIDVAENKLFNLGTYVPEIFKKLSVFVLWF
jgi:hypothetical protein